MRIVLGFIGIVCSFLLVIYRGPLKLFIGRIEWAERKLGEGGTYTIMVLAALFLFIFSLMYMTNSFDLIFGGIGVDFFQSVE
jgi:hypothetical protein